jgi:hypothetical protein
MELKERTISLQDVGEVLNNVNRKAESNFGNGSHGHSLVYATVAMILAGILEQYAKSNEHMDVQEIMAVETSFTEKSLGAGLEEIINTLTRLEKHI